MKYKIGNVEVEAVQWNGESEFKKISDFLDDIKFGLYGISRDKKDNIAIEDGDYEKVAFLEVGQYLVKSKTSLFTLSEQDFNNMATKVKEPKFKVGDVAFLVEDCGDEELSIVRYIITDFYDDHQVGFVYEIDYTEKMSESHLLTLEEAIEKLKEL